jgi:four helix bundle protein
MSTSQNTIVSLSEAFALETIHFSSILKKADQRELAFQLFKSGTSIGANVAEAQHAESKIDFIHKLKIASKEARETAFWLKLCRLSEHLPENPQAELMLLSIEKMLSKIISTSKKSLTQK